MPPPKDDVSIDKIEKLIGDRWTECREKFRTAEGCKAIHDETKNAIKSLAGRNFAWGVNILLGIIILFLIGQTKWFVGMHNDQSEKIHKLETSALTEKYSFELKLGVIERGIDDLTKLLILPPKDTTND